MIVHHAPAKLHVSSDDIRLADAHTLVNVLALHPDPWQGICGHVHMATSSVMHAVPCTALVRCRYRTVPTNLDRDERLAGSAQYLSIRSDQSATIVRFKHVVDRNTSLAHDPFTGC